MTVLKMQTLCIVNLSSHYCYGSFIVKSPYPEILNSISFTLTESIGVKHRMADTLFPCALLLFLTLSTYAVFFFQKIAEISLHVVNENQDRALTPFSEGWKRLLNGLGVASARINIFNLSSNGVYI